LGARAHRDLRPGPAHLSPEETRPLLDAINDLLARLRDAIGMQQRFIANAAHQLRTPLAAVLTQAELLDRSGLPAEHRAEVSRLHAAVTRAARLASQLLTLARADPTDGPALRRQRVDLEAMCEELVPEWVARADERGIDLGFELEAAQADGDPTLLRELIRNLLDNALKYTPPGGAVTLHVAGGDAAVIEVEDDGPGIPAGERERVTERFYRLDSSSAEGSGLGLAIVREIAAAHGAVLHIGEGAGGRGTRVSVRFEPLATASSVSAPAETAAPTGRSTSR
jgi:two-component system sensor histidine kinase TctE